MTMQHARTLMVLSFFAVAGCSSVQEGIVVQKRARAEMPEAYDLYELSYRFEPSIYWVEVEGKDAKGRERIKNIILFRHDWLQLRVGDHWSRRQGFSPAESDK